MAASPLHDKMDLPTFTVKVGGSAIKDYYQVTNITVEKEINKISKAEVTLIDGNPADQNFELSETEDFVPGNEIEIDMGYHSDESSVFQGIITSQQIKVRSTRSKLLSVITVKCSDKAIKLTSGRKSATYEEQTDSDVITSIISDAGLDKSVEASDYTHKKVVQFDCSDWDFILSRAEINGFLAICEDGKLQVAPPALSGSAALELTYGVDVIDFQAELDAKSQYASVSCSGWDSTEKEVTNGVSEEPSGNDIGNISGKDLSSVLWSGKMEMLTASPESTPVLKAWADAKLQKARLARITGYVTIPGSSLAKIGTLITLKGFGARFNGDAYISKVVHTIESGNWTTYIGFGLSPEFFQETRKLESPPAAGLLPGVSGLHAGIVKQIHEDPDGEYRVLVDVPLMDASGDGIWARMSSDYASSEVGNYFYPEVSDEVILGFLNEDPRFPVILGALYGKKSKPPFTPDEENTKKGIKTKSELQLTFDEEKKEVVIQTPGGNVVTISDDAKGITMEDQNGNKVEMNDSGITLDSSKDIKISAGGKCSISATSDIDISATGDASLTGNNVSAKANLALSAEGTSQASFKASGVLEVKGAMVNIN
ncbi:MAG: type VI secretion system tip protein VgrG [Bacteroidota bacterium]